MHTADRSCAHHEIAVHRVCSCQNFLDMPLADQLDMKHTLEELMDAPKVAFQSDLYLHSRIHHRLQLTQVSGNGFFHLWEPEHFVVCQYY